MQKRLARLLVAVPAVVLAGLAGARVAADEERYPPVTNPVVAKECGACHMTYQPGLLPAASWDRMVGGLKDHFGENADVDPAIAAEMRTYLMANAALRLGPRMQAPGKTGLDAMAPLRITELNWFVRKHGRGRISPAALQKAGAKSASACQACHLGAERGDYGD